jgi:hypothetical protein
VGGSDEAEMKYTTGLIEETLDVATDALKRRARVLQGQDPEIADKLLLLASRLEPGLLAPERKGRA